MSRRKTDLLYEAHRRFFKFPAIQKLKTFIEESGYDLVLYETFEEGCGGYFDMVEKEIGIRLRTMKNDSWLSPEQFCFFLAHESRHLLHSVEGRFQSYYNREYKVLVEKGTWNPMKADEWDMVPKIGVGVRAERDCDRWATSYVKTYINKTFSYEDFYPTTSVAHYQASCMWRHDMKKNLRERYIALHEKTKLIFRRLDPSDNSRNQKAYRKELKIIKNKLYLVIADARKGQSFFFDEACSLIAFINEAEKSTDLLENSVRKVA